MLLITIVSTSNSWNHWNYRNLLIQTVCLYWANLQILDVSALFKWQIKQLLLLVNKWRSYLLLNFFFQLLTIAIDLYIKTSTRVYLQNCRQILKVCFHVRFMRHKIWEQIQKLNIILTISHYSNCLFVYNYEIIQFSLFSNNVTVHKNDCYSEIK